VCEAGGLTCEGAHGDVCMMLASRVGTGCPPLYYPTEQFAYLRGTSGSEQLDAEPTLWHEPVS
jgi:hypothetical protein